MEMIENEIAAKDQLTEQVQRFKDELNGKDGDMSKTKQQANAYG